MTHAHALRRAGLLTCAMALLAFGTTCSAQPANTDTVQVHVNAKATGSAFPHFWEQMFGSGRAVLELRADYRKDLDSVKKATGFTYIRPHGIFNREVGLFHLDEKGKPVYNFSYVDRIYDNLLKHGVKPFVELSFMPPDLASDPKALQAFWYQPNVSPPKSYTLWDGMIKTFARHLVKRYGIKEVSSWYFEVWNEPNIGFWVGKPKQSTYFKLYDHTARALKSVSPKLRVGGPATAQAAWIPAFLKHTKKDNVPVDFVSTHVYGDDTAQNVFHSSENIPRKDMVCRAVSKVHRQIEASAYPDMPFVMSEYNASYANLPNVTDSVYMGPWLANMIHACAGKVQIMSYWSFSDVFEEQGVVKTPFYGGFGLIAADRIDKPAFNAFAMLHKLGHTRLPLDNDSGLATRRKDGTVVLALWNYAPPVGKSPDAPPMSLSAHYNHGKPQGAVKHVNVDVTHLGSVRKATVWRLDRSHGNVIKTFDAMGRPADPSREQIKTLRQAGTMAPPEQVAVHDGTFSIDIPPQGLVVVQLH